MFVRFAPGTARHIPGFASKLYRCDFDKRIRASFEAVRFKVD